MKKIIELAEKYLNAVDNADGIEELEYEAEGSKMKLQSALVERRKLEQTPITEELLKKHGWKNPKSLYFASIEIGNDYLEYNLQERELEVYRDYKSGSDAYANVLIDNIVTFADLYDACELCGIELN